MPNNQIVPKILGWDMWVEDEGPVHHLKTGQASEV